MLTINWKQIYEVSINNTKQWILILYNISQNHYVGIPIYSKNKDNTIYLKSIDKYVILDEIDEYNRNNIKRCIYIKGQFLKITNKEFNKIILKAKDSFLDYIKNSMNNNLDSISYSKWCKDKLKLINKDVVITNLKIGAICWVELGYNIGNELRKLRPAILWRSSSDKKMWTVIPLTSKRRTDCYYFHYNLKEAKLGTARIENLINISIKRIKEPYFIKNKIATITKNDNDEIIKIIKKYYAFEEINISDISKIRTTNRKIITNSKSKEIRKKVLT